MSIGPLMLDLEGYTLAAEEADVLKQPEVGGLILFARNYSNPEQLRELMAEIRAVRPDILVAVDQEGGRVQRFKDGFTRLPPMRSLGSIYHQNHEKALADATELGWLMASELREYQVDFSFAPVLDLDWGRSSVIGNRAFAQSAKTVTEISRAFMQGMHQAGMAATGKHFPGHGWVEADSHLDIPVDERTFSEIEKQDMQPFAALINDGLDAIMPAHVIYSNVRAEPAGFSPYWLRRVLREQLGFEGVIFSDDLTMEGASVAGDFPQRCDRAIEAGCDMVLVCNQSKAARQVLDHLKAHPCLPSERLESMQGKPFAMDTARMEQARETARQYCTL